MRKCVRQTVVSQQRAWIIEARCPDDIPSINGENTELISSNSSGRWQHVTVSYKNPAVNEWRDYYYYYYRRNDYVYSNLVFGDGGSFYNPYPTVSVCAKFSDS